jgi:hypothetical protein
VTQQPFSRLVAKDQDTNRIVQDIYDKLATALSQISDLSNQVSVLQKKVATLP